MNVPNVHVYMYSPPGSGMGPVSWGPEVSSRIYYDIQCLPEIQVVFPNITCIFARKLILKNSKIAILKNSKGGCSPPAPPPPRLVRLWSSSWSDFGFTADTNEQEEGAEKRRRRRTEEGE